jgi:hypothetical protein
VYQQPGYGYQAPTQPQYQTVPPSTAAPRQYSQPQPQATAPPSIPSIPTQSAVQNEVEEFEDLVVTEGGEMSNTAGGEYVYNGVELMGDYSVLILADNLLLTLSGRICRSVQLRYPGVHRVIPSWELPASDDTPGFGTAGSIPYGGVVCESRRT